MSIWLRNNVLGLIAIFIALSGTAVATQVASESGKKAREARKAKRGPRGFTGAQGPAGAQGIQGAPGANGSPDTGAQILSKLSPVDGAGSGLDADLLDGLNSAAFAQKGSEAWHELGAADGVSCTTNDLLCSSGINCYWQAHSPDASSPAYMRDPSGIVHVKGVVRRINSGCSGTATGWIFHLPAGYQPSKLEAFPIVSNDAFGAVYIHNNFPGLIELRAGQPDVWVSLDGISFRCEPSGANGCP